MIHVAGGLLTSSLLDWGSSGAVGDTYREYVRCCAGDPAGGLGFCKPPEASLARPVRVGWVDRWLLASCFHRIPGGRLPVVAAACRRVRRWDPPPEGLCRRPSARRETCSAETPAADGSLGELCVGRWKVSEDPVVRRGGSSGPGVWAWKGPESVAPAGSPIANAPCWVHVRYRRLGLPRSYCGAMPPGRGFAACVDIRAALRSGLRG